MSVRKRLQQQSQLVENDTLQTNFSEEEIRPAQEVENKEIPKKYFLAVSNLKTMMPEDYAQKRRDIKHSKYADYWENEINAILEVYDVEADKYHINLVRSICQIVEDYVIYTSKSGPVKRQIVMNVCLKFFDNNEKLLSAIIESQLCNITHSTLFRRVCSRFQVLFFSNQL